MGWTIHYQGKSLEQCLKEETQGLTVLKQKAGRDGSRTLRWFLVESNGHRFVCLAICERDKGEWHIKMIDESCGPCNVDCLIEYLEGLPDPVGYAAQWRERVRAFHATKAPSLQKGTVFIRSSDAKYHNREATLVSLSPLEVWFNGWRLKVKKAQLRNTPW